MIQSTIYISMIRPISTLASDVYSIKVWHDSCNFFKLSTYFAKEICIKCSSLIIFFHCYVTICTKLLNDISGYFIISLLRSLGIHKTKNLMHHDHSSGFAIKLWTSSTAHHLQHICDWEIHLVCPTVSFGIFFVGGSFQTKMQENHGWYYVHFLNLFDGWKRGSQRIVKLRWGIEHRKGEHLSGVETWRSFNGSVGLRVQWLRVKRVIPWPTQHGPMSRVTYLFSCPS